MKKEIDNKVENSLKTKIPVNKESLIYKFGQYLIKPSYSEREESALLNKILKSYRLYAFTLSLIILIGILIGVLLALSGFNSQDNAVADLVINNSILNIIAIIIIIGPIIEELTFRLGLRFSNIKASLNLGLIIGLIPSFLPQNFFSEFLPRILLSLLVFLVSYLILKRISKDKLINWYKNRFGIIFYLSAILFGLAHISNYTNQSQIWFLLPILIAPQLLAGLLFGYIRSAYGFGYSILLHMSHNFITISPILILSIFNIGFEKLQDPSLINSQDAVLIGLVFILFLIGILLVLLINIWNLIELFYLPKSKNRSAFVPN